MKDLSVNPSHHERNAFYHGSTSCSPETRETVEEEQATGSGTLAANCSGVPSLTGIDLRPATRQKDTFLYEPELLERDHLDDDVDTGRQHRRADANDEHDHPSADCLCQVHSLKHTDN